MKPAYLLGACAIALSSFVASDVQATEPQRSASGTLRVVVHDPSGAVIPGAVVRVTSAESGSMAPVELISDGQGLAMMRALEPGRYGVTVSFSGFETRTVSDSGSGAARPGVT